jgi:hypothetical protein
MSLEPEDKMKMTLKDLIDEVGEWMTEAKNKGLIKSDPKLIIPMAKIFLQQVEPSFIIENFISHTSVFWINVINKEEEHFKLLLNEIPSILSFDQIKEEKQKNKMFSIIPDQLVDDAILDIKNFADMKYVENGVLHDILNQERKEMLWKISHSFIKFSVQYIHSKRKWCKETKKYTVTYQPQVKLKSLISENFKINLTYN